MHQLRKVRYFQARRAELAERYSRSLAGLPLQLPTVLPEVQSAWHLYPVRVSSGGVTRDDVIEGLRRWNIGASLHFIPLHLMSFYRRAFGYKRGDFPMAEEAFQRILSLPFFPRMSDADVVRVARALEHILVR
jgi:dTDP-4-amino-4,6-dideoxygalactose transaminase